MSVAASSAVAPYPQGVDCTISENRHTTSSMRYAGWIRFAFILLMHTSCHVCKNMPSSRLLALNIILHTTSER